MTGYANTTSRCGLLYMSVYWSKVTKTSSKFGLLFMASKEIDLQTLHRGSAYCTWQVLNYFYEHYNKALLILHGRSRTKVGYTSSNFGLLYIASKELE